MGLLQGRATGWSGGQSEPTPIRPGGIPGDSCPRLKGCQLKTGSLSTEASAGRSPAALQSASVQVRSADHRQRTTAMSASVGLFLKLEGTQQPAKISGTEDGSASRGSAPSALPQQPSRMTPTVRRQREPTETGAFPCDLVG